eukprot:6209300-Pleurochrysis_carterae.AAC.2
MRHVRTHMPLVGETEPDPYNCCAYANNPTTQDTEREAFDEQLTQLHSGLHTEKGKKWTVYVRHHKLKHEKVGPGKTFTPVLPTQLDDCEAAESLARRSE